MLDENTDRWEYPQALAEREHVSAYIIIHGPGHDGTRLALREGITSFGRLPSNDVILLGDLVSRHHSRITFFEARATLQDLGSHNGSWVNGERVTTRVLKDGDVVRVGNFRLAFHEGPIGEPDDTAFDETTAEQHDESPRRNATLLVERKRLSAPRQTGRAARSGDGSEPPVLERESSPSGSVLIQEIERVRAGGEEADPSRLALVLLYKASEALASVTSSKAYVQELLGLLLEQIRAEFAVFLRLGDDQSLSIMAARDAKGPLEDPPVSLGVVRWVTSKNFTIASEDITKDLRFEAGESADIMRAVVCLPISSGAKVIGALYLARGAPMFSDTEVDALGALAHLASLGMARAEVRDQALEESLTREMLSRFHSPDVVEQLIKNAKPGLAPQPFLQGKTATVSFCDIHGFSQLVERLPELEATEFVSTYLEQMSDIILKHRGTVNRLMGSTVMGIFGAPFAYGNDAIRAISAALEMRDAFDALIRARPHFGPRRLRFGIDTGWMLTGMVGSSRRLEYTAIGDTVTAASRLEASAAPGAVLIGEATYPLVADAFEVRKLGIQQIRGRYEPIQVYEVLNRKRSGSRVR